MKWATGTYAFAVWPATEGHRSEMVNRAFIERRLQFDYLGKKTWKTYFHRGHCVRFGSDRCRSRRPNWDSSAPRSRCRRYTTPTPQCVQLLSPRLNSTLGT